MKSDDPPFLTEGTEVSAKFKGAFCEAKITEVTKLIKCKVLLKEAPFGSITVEDWAIKGDVLELNKIVEVQHNDSTLKAMIQSLKDCSTYEVVFDDGEKKLLRRTQLRLKGARHFDQTQNLDAFPLNSSEDFKDLKRRLKDEIRQNGRNNDEDKRRRLGDA